MSSRFEITASADDDPDEIRLSATTVDQNSASGNRPGKIAKSIRDAIMHGEFAPGAHLNQVELADQFGVSRAPVREALKILAAEHLVTYDHNRGFSIPSLSSEEAEQIYLMRNLIESEILSTIEWPTPIELRRFWTLVAEIEQAIVCGDVSGWMVRHRELHRAIFDLSPRKVMAREAFRLWTLSDRYRSLMLLRQTSSPGGGSRDRQLVEAIEKMDRTRVLSVFTKWRRVVADHIVTALRAYGM